MYSINTLVTEYIKHTNKENYKDPNDPAAAGTILGLSLAIFFVLLLLTIGLWFFALFYLMKHWNELPDWAKALGVLGLIPAVPLGPIVTIIAVAVGKNDKSALKN